MKLKFMPNLLLLLLSSSTSLGADTDAAKQSAFTKDVQGDWHVLTAHCGNKNVATGNHAGSRVSITDGVITWHDPQDKENPLISAACFRAAAPADPKKQADPNELKTTVRGSLCPVPDAKLAARWRITDTGTLIALIEIAAFKGNRNGTFSGASPADVVIVCQRQPVPAALKTDSDAERFVGKWDRLAELDDANTARTRPNGTVEFTAKEFFKRGSKNPSVKPQMDGTWSLQKPQDDRGRIDLVFRSGIEGNQGRSPSLYTFYGDDILMIVFPEGGWAKDARENQALRRPPTHFGSDGNRNMWILRRNPDNAVRKPVKEKQP
jgi:hypothetical protein